MTDDRTSTDGGETAIVDIERAGDDPPDPPSEGGLERMLPDLLGEFEIDTTVFMIRAGLTDGSGRPVGERLVDAIEEKVTVVGTTLDAGFEPSNPVLDVLVETDHDHGTIAASLARVDPVEGVVVADVTAAAERELEADGTEEPDASDGGDANAVFNELKEEVGEEGYGDVVDELEDVEFPGGPDPEEEVDLEAEAGVDLSGPDPDEPIDLEGDGSEGTLDLDDDEDISTKELLGEDGRDGADVKGPDEKAIEEAIEEVDLDDEEGDTQPSESPAGGDEQPEPPEAEDSPEAEESPEPPGDETGTASTAEGAAASTAPEDMDAFVGQLVEAVESGEVDGERVAELRTALGVQSTHNLDVRMEHVQKRVDNLAAYTDAWEAFLSEEGSGRDFMTSVKEDLADIEQRLAEVEGGDAGAGEDLAAIEQRLARVEAAVESIEERHDDDVARLDTRMDNVESKLENRVQSVEETVGALKEKVRSLLEWREHIDDVVGD